MRVDERVIISKMVKTIPTAGKMMTGAQIYNVRAQTPRINTFEENLKN